MTANQVFEPSSIGGIPLRNRMIRSATGDGLADKDGRPTPELIEFYVRLARGGAGAIITGFTGTQRSGKSSTYHALMFDRDEFIDAYRELTEPEIEEIISGNKADYVAMSRAFICEPDIVKRFEAGTQSTSGCISCNFCITCIESMPFKFLRESSIGDVDGPRRGTWVTGYC